MSFGQFLIYFIGASFINQLLMIGVYLLRRRYIQYKMKKAIASGNVRVVTMEELAEEMAKQGDGKKSWN